MTGTPEPSDCVVCGGTVAPDGHCWDCGEPQPAYRSCLETTLGTGTGTCAAGVSDHDKRRGLNADAMALTSTGAWKIGVVCDGVSMSPRAGRAVTALAASVDEAPACTYVSGIAGPEGIWCAWIGDSRAYWLPDEGTCLALTEDDSGRHDALTAWLGASSDEPAEPTARVRSYRPRGPGRLPLCTDGLTRHLSDAAELRAVLARRGPPTPHDHRLL